MKSKNGFWYFAHPYTCRKADGSFVPEGEQANFELCNIRAGELLLRGYNIYSPISHTHPIHRATVAFLAAEEHDLWYQLDFDFMERANFDGVILAPGWDKSSGCQGELAWIKKHGGRVLLYDDVVAGVTVQGETLAEFEKEKDHGPGQDSDERAGREAKQDKGKDVGSSPDSSA